MNQDFESGESYRSRDKTSPTVDLRSETRRMAKSGYALAGVGLFLLALTVAAMLNGITPPIGPCAIGVCMTAELALVIVGFALMVVASNPFDDDDATSSLNALQNECDEGDCLH